MNSRAIRFETQKGPATGFMAVTPRERRLSDVSARLEEIYINSVDRVKPGNECTTERFDRIAFKVQGEQRDQHSHVEPQR